MWGIGRRWKKRRRRAALPVTGDKLVDYLARMEDVEGWLLDDDAEFTAHLSKAQVDRHITGSVGEIGVHHGKLLILLKLTARPDEKVFAVDVFEHQELNTDMSGAGDRTRFTQNVVKWTGDLDNLSIITADSQTLSGQEILAVAGPARMISIDGGHTQECTCSDLRLAEKILLETGIVVLDDVFNSCFPAVAAGTFDYLSSSEAALRPFAVSTNKTFLARPEMHGIYQEIGSRFAPVPGQHATVGGFRVDVWRRRYPV